MKLLETPKFKGGTLMAFLAAGICIGARLCASADAPAWPDTFWTQVSNHVAAVAPSGGQVAHDSNASVFSSFAQFSLPGEGFGTVAAPFDSICWLNFITDVMLLDKRPPFGMTLSFK